MQFALQNVFVRPKCIWCIAYIMDYCIKLFHSSLQVPLSSLPPLPLQHQQKGDSSHSPSPLMPTHLPPVTTLHWPGVVHPSMTQGWLSPLQVSLLLTSLVVTVGSTRLQQAMLRGLPPSLSQVRTRMLMLQEMIPLHLTALQVMATQQCTVTYSWRTVFLWQKEWVGQSSPSPSCEEQ